jgi:hypothetical protein
MSIILLKPEETMKQENREDSTGYQGSAEKGSSLFQGHNYVFNGFPFKPLWILVIIFLLGGSAALITQAPLILAKNQCSQELTNAENAKSILTACQNVLDREPNNLDAMKNAGRASLVTWNRDWESSQKESLFNKTEDYFNRLYQLNTANPQAAFYQEFMQDFRGLVLSPQPQCKLVKDTYSRSIDLYTKETYRIYDKDFPILVELGHFLINRDREFQQAINLFDRIPKSNTEFYRDILSSKAIARTLQGNFSGARDFFMEALDVDQKLPKPIDETSYKIKNNLASTYAQSALSESNSQVRNSYYDEAIKLYKETTQPNVASKNYYAWRNLGFLFYLKREYSQSLAAFDTALSFENQGVKTVDALDRFRKDFIYDYREKARENAGDSSENAKDNSTLEKGLTEKRIFSGYFITHEGSQDPFFQVEHGKFYACVK